MSRVIANFTKDDLALYVTEGIFRPLPLTGAEGYYVSNDGDVYSAKHTKVVKMKPADNKSGYPKLGLFVNGKSACFSIHRLVALTWLPNPNNLKVVNHKDGNKANFHPSNLEFVTPQQNSRHAVDNNLSSQYSIPILQMTNRGKVVAEFKSITEAIAQTGFAKRGLSSCVYGYTKEYKGFIWRVKDELNTKSFNPNPPVGKYCKISGELIATFDNTELAVESTGCRLFKNRGLGYLNKTDTMFTWKYVVRTSTTTSEPLNNPDDWKEVTGFADYMVSKTGKVYSNFTGKIITPYLSQNRSVVKLAGGTKKHNPLYIHRLVAIAFIPNPNNYELVNHKDGNPQNNHVSNLEWCTHRQNIIHAIETGLTNSRKAVIQICAKTGTEIARYDSVTAAAKAVGVWLSNLSGIIKNDKTSNNGMYKWRYA